MGICWNGTAIYLSQKEHTMNYGPSSYLPRNAQTDMQATTEALQAILGPTEATWLHSNGSKIFRIDLSGIVDNERRISNYLKVRK